MGRRIALGLVALWLLLSLPANLAVLKELIRVAFWVAAGLYAGLDRWLWTQYLLATIFTLWVAALLVWPVKLGRTLAVVLLMGGCGVMTGLMLADPALHGRLPTHWAIVVTIIALNLACLRALAVPKEKTLGQN